MAEYLRAHPEHSAEDFRIIKELSDELLYHDYHSDNYHGYWKADQDFSGLAALVPSRQRFPTSSLQNRGRWKACCEKNSFALLFV